MRILPESQSCPNLSKPRLIGCWQSGKSRLTPPRATNSEEEIGTAKLGEVEMRHNCLKHTGKAVVLSFKKHSRWFMKRALFFRVI